MNGTEISGLVIKIIKWILLIGVVISSYTGYRGIRNVGCWDTISSSVRLPIVLVVLLVLMMSADDILARLNLVSAKKDEQKAVMAAAEVIEMSPDGEESDSEDDEE
tara:strand:+ start:1089 stop:1406 length:318 start_codon:yes stop_codon:yes gene_type:complete